MLNLPRHSSHWDVRGKCVRARVCAGVGERESERDRAVTLFMPNPILDHKQVCTSDFVENRRDHGWSTGKDKEEGYDE